MTKLTIALFVLATLMPYEAFARGDSGTRLERKAAHGSKMVRHKRAATKVKSGRTYGFTASAGKKLWPLHVLEGRPMQRRAGQAQPVEGVLRR